jgi:hypothetical protein
MLEIHRTLPSIAPQPRGHGKCKDSPKRDSKEDSKEDSAHFFLCDFLLRKLASLTQYASAKSWLSYITRVHRQRESSDSTAQRSTVNYLSRRLGIATGPLSLRN